METSTAATAHDHHCQLAIKENPRDLIIHQSAKREREILMKCCGLSSYLLVMSSHLTLTSRKKNCSTKELFFGGCTWGTTTILCLQFFVSGCALFYLVQELLLGADRILLHLHDNHFSITFFLLIEQDLIFIGWWWCSWEQQNTPDVWEWQQQPHAFITSHIQPQHRRCTTWWSSDPSTTTICGTTQQLLRQSIVHAQPM